MKKPAALSLSPHPRLYIGTDEMARLRERPATAFLRDADRRLREDADAFATSPPLVYARNVHNEHLLRAREVQRRMVTLLARWTQTEDARYRRAALRLVQDVGEWDCWSWITWRQGNHKPDAIFDLSYGENSATLAIARDWLDASLSAAEKSLFRDVANRWPLASARRNVRPGAAWWYGKPDCNWNTVCAGGLAMLVLALADEIPDAPALLAECERSIEPYMLYLNQTHGAWPEGIGYWNYGMRYAFMYLLSHENALGRPNPLLRQASTRRTLAFPLDFCPNGQPCSFGDVNHWTPLPFHYAAARRLGERPVVAGLDAILADPRLRLPARARDSWPSDAEWRLFHDGRAAARPETGSGPALRFYRGMDWAAMADRLPNPRLYVSVRGGSTKVPHSHRDLMSFHCVVGRERMIVNLTPDEYLDTTFSPRRDEILETSPAAKNTILVNGVGIVPGSALDRTEPVRTKAGLGVRLVASGAMGAMRDGPAVRFCGRLVLLLLGGKAVLIVDRTELPHVGRMESRLHTHAAVRASEAGALLALRGERLRVTCAATVPAVFRTALTAPTTPTAASATVLRWCSRAQSLDLTFATLLTPGAAPARVTVERDGRRIVVTAGGPGWQATVPLSPLLRPA